ncbi:hypothetical protein LQG66_16390 [Bradyrhizobium ontarionense]|uniref:DUF3592 domain-containing protein n=1 Tax=Bradyrhizobium ontarionense TaxID=2898149 RepID=A0ABY3RKD1_9BRAD|nr:hypothetical protein [Bradyrhizobium sp. A19]UFZ07783.1 hypothetical protein LQG66_16390 [Bradyrhizobium sp. A19]
MNPDQFVKVFDVLDAGFMAWWITATGLTLVIATGFFAAVPSLLQAMRIPYLPKSNVSRYGPVVFAILWTAGAFALTFAQYYRHHRLAMSGECRVVEGLVEQFTPVPSGRHPSESFTVSGTTFKYSDTDMNEGFNMTAARGGPLTPDAYVRICYDPSGNVILRLEIRGFAGPVTKQVGNPILRQAPDRPSSASNPVDIPSWLTPLLFGTALLDLVAIAALYPLYLGKFLRIAREQDRFVLRSDLQAGKRVTLSTCVVYWDELRDVIWLRPRGLILFQIPLVVGRLHVDATTRAVIGWDICLAPTSSLAFVVVGAGLFGPPLAAAGGQTSSLLGFLVGGLLGLLIVVLNVAASRSRMRAFVQQRLPEIAAPSPWTR